MRGRKRTRDLRDEFGESFRLLTQKIELVLLVAVQGTITGNFKKERECHAQESCPGSNLLSFEGFSFRDETHGLNQAYIQTFSTEAGVHKPTFLKHKFETVDIWKYIDEPKGL